MHSSLSKKIIGLDRNEYMFPQPQQVIKMYEEACKYNWLAYYAKEDDRELFKSRIANFIGINFERLELTYGGEDALLKLFLLFRTQKEHIIVPKHSWHAYKLL